jgi:YHS domain-containing protein
MHEHRVIAPDEDPVCGMTVDPEAARQKGLSQEHEGVAYVFCGKGCFLDFRDDPEIYLSTDHAPSM